jgi:hypothetical protein
MRRLVPNGFAVEDDHSRLMTIDNRVADQLRSRRGDSEGWSVSSRALASVDRRRAMRVHSVDGQTFAAPVNDGSDAGKGGAPHCVVTNRSNIEPKCHLDHIPSTPKRLPAVPRRWRPPTMPILSRVRQSCMAAGRCFPRSGLTYRAVWEHCRIRQGSADL